MAATTTAGVLSRPAKCEEHGVEYLQLNFPSMRLPGRELVWSGQCPKCSDDEKLTATANAELQEYHPAIAAEVMPLVLARENEIEELTYREFDLYVARLTEAAREMLPTFEASVRQAIWSEEWDKIAERKFQEIVERLKKEDSL
jgi:hypothetical protein